MLEDHNIPQLVGICGITLTYVLAVIFNTLNGIGGKLPIMYLKINVFLRIINLSVQVVTRTTFAYLF